MFRNFAFAATIATLITSPAMAQDKVPFSGPRVGVDAGWGRTSGAGRIASDGFTYGVTLGYDIPSGPVRIGPEVRIGDSTQRECRAYPAGGTAARTCQRSDRDLYAGLRLGYVASPSVLIFANGGYSNARFSDRLRDVTVGPAHDSKVARNASGYRFGGGVEYAIGSHAYVSGAYQYSAWKHSDWRNHAHQNQLLGGIGYRF